MHINIYMYICINICIYIYIYIYSTRKPNFDWAGVDACGRVRHPPCSKKLFVRVAGLHASVCVHKYMQYATHTNRRTGEERTDRAGAKSAAHTHTHMCLSLTHSLCLPVQRVRQRAHMTMMHSWTFRAHHEEVFTHVVVWFLILMPWCRICKTYGTHMNESWHTWMSHGTHLNESWHTYEWVMSHIWKHACAPPRALLPLHAAKNQMCVHLCLCLCASLSLSLCLCPCLFLCVNVSVCKYNHIYTYAHACIRVHTHRDRSTKTGQEKGAMSH